MQLAKQFVESGCVCDGKRYIPVVRFVGLYGPVDNATGYPNKTKDRKDNLLAKLQGKGTWSIVEAASTGPNWRDFQSRGYFERPIPGGSYRENLPPNIFKEIPGSHSALGGNPCHKEINRLKITETADRQAAIDADQWIRNAAIKAGLPVLPKTRDSYGYPK